MSKTIYLSYAHADKAWADHLLQTLVQGGYIINESPDEAGYLLVIASPTGVVAEGVLNDLDKFLDDEREIIPVVPPYVQGDEDFLLSDLEARAPIYFEANNPASYREVMQRLGEPPRGIVLSGHVPPSNNPLSRIPLVWFAFALLILAIIGAFALPNDTPLPSFLGFGLLGLVAIGFMMMVAAVFQQSMHRAAPAERISLPPAFLQVVRSSRKSDLGKRYPLQHRQTTLGSHISDHVRLQRGGVQPSQCTIHYVLRDDVFYLETVYPWDGAITTIHDRLLPAQKPLALWNGDLISLNEELVLQFRFKTPE